MTFLRVADGILVPALLIFLLLGGLAGGGLGLALLLRTAGTLRFINTMNGWVSTRRATRGLEIPRSAFRPESKWGKNLLGVFLAVGGVFSIYFLVSQFALLPPVLVVYGVDLQKWLVASILVQTVRWCMVAGSILAVVMGMLVLFFPAALASVEARMNRWQSTRTMLSPEGDRMKLPLEALVEAYPRASGWLIVVASFMVAASMVLMLIARWAR